MKSSSIKDPPELRRKMELFTAEQRTLNKKRLDLLESLRFDFKAYFISLFHDFKHASFYIPSGYSFHSNVSFTCRFNLIIVTYISIYIYFLWRKKNFQSLFIREVESIIYLFILFIYILQLFLANYVQGEKVQRGL